MNASGTGLFTIAGYITFADIVVSVGSSKDQAKTVYVSSLTDDFTCPEVLSCITHKRDQSNQPPPGWTSNMKDYALKRECNWLSIKDSDDNFKVTVDLPNKQITVERTDRRGWDMDLQFKCKSLIRTTLLQLVFRVPYMCGPFDLSRYHVHPFIIVETHQLILLPLIGCPGY